jgi:TP901 family phage tail tape measure protein
VNTKNIAVILSANATSFKTQMAIASGAVKDFEKTTDSSSGGASKWAMALKAAAVVVALAVAAIAVSAVSMAADFDRSMRNVNSISKMPEDALKRIESQVISLSTTLPQSAKELADGLYDIASSGYQGAAGVEILTASAKAATAGLSDTATASKAIVAVINAYGLEARDSTLISDVLFQTVNDGVITFSELASQIGDVIGMASAAHIPINEVGAAIAAMTLSGVNAAESTTSLNRVIQAIIDPSDELKNVFNSLGYESGFAALQALGLHGTMEKLRVVTGGNVEALMKLFPNVRAARGAFALMAADGANYNRTFHDIGIVTNAAGATQAAFTEQMKAVSAQWDIFTNKLNAGLITMGMKMLPAVSASIVAMEDFSAAAVDLGQNIGQRLQPFFDGLGQTTRNVASFLATLTEDAWPVVEVLTAISALGIIDFLNAFATTLATITGPLASNETLVRALEVALAGLAAKSVITAIAELASALADRLAVGAYNAVGGVTALASSIGEWLVASGPWIAAAGVAYGAFTILNDITSDNVINADNYTEALKRQNGTLQENADLVSAQSLYQSDAAVAADKAGLSFGEMFAAIRDGTDDWGAYSREVENSNFMTDDAAAGLRAAGAESTAFGQKLIELASSGDLSSQQVLDLVNILEGLHNGFLAGKDGADAFKKANTDATTETQGLGGAASGAGIDIEGLKQRMQSAADQAKQMENNIKALDDELHALMDPLFGMLDATTKNTEALQKAAEAHKKYGDGSKEAAAADEEAAKSALDVESAAIKLAGAVQMGTVSVDDAKQTLNEWVAQGLITQQQADAISGKFAWMAAQADALQGKNIAMVVNLDDQAARAELASLQHLANSGVIVSVPTGVNLSRRWGGVIEHAQVGLLRDANIYSQPMYAFAEAATGGEAFIPKNGDTRRSLAILSQAAAWYGMAIAPATRSTGSQRVPTTTTATTTGAGGDVVIGRGAVSVTVNADAGVDGARLEAAVTRAVEPALVDFAKTLNREMRTRS